MGAKIEAGPVESRGTADGGGAFVTMMSSAAALLAEAMTMTAVAMADQSFTDRRDPIIARIAALAILAREYPLFDRIFPTLAMAASVRVTTRSVTTAEVRPKRAPRAQEG